MTVNKYFSLHHKGHSNEQDLLHGFAIESIQISGIDCWYLPRTSSKRDELYGEDILSSFDTKYEIEMRILSYDGYEGEDILQTFGLQVTDNLSLEVSTRRFVELIGMEKPLEGDLIYFPLGKSLFEIKYVEDEDPFYPLGTQPYFTMKCELFDYSYEDITTLSDIDDQLDPTDEINTEFDDGVTDGLTEPITSSDPFYNNDVIEQEVIDILDWSDASPFGSF